MEPPTLFLTTSNTAITTEPSPGADLRLARFLAHTVLPDLATSSPSHPWLSLIASSATTPASRLNPAFFAPRHTPPAGIEVLVRTRHLSTTDLPPPTHSAYDPAATEPNLIAVLAAYCPALASALLGLHLTAARVARVGPTPIAWHADPDTGGVTLYESAQEVVPLADTTLSPLAVFQLLYIRTALLHFGAELLPATQPLLLGVAPAPVTTPLTYRFPAPHSTGLALLVTLPATATTEHVLLDPSAALHPTFVARLLGPAATAAAPVHDELALLRWAAGRVPGATATAVPYYDRSTGPTPTYDATVHRVRGSPAIAGPAVAHPRGTVLATAPAPTAYPLLAPALPHLARPGPTLPARAAALCLLLADDHDPTALRTTIATAGLAAATRGAAEFAHDQPDATTTERALALLTTPLDSTLPLLSTTRPHPGPRGHLVAPLEADGDEAWAVLRDFAL